MRITHVHASNWKNFKTLDFPMESRLFIVGPNASGKSNLLDLFRFLNDLAVPGGGLAYAFEKRGGLTKTRSLFARNFKGGHIEIDIEFSDDSGMWQYFLSIKNEGHGRHRPIVHEERVQHNGENVLTRPDQNDLDDPERMTQTHLEQISANQRFRVLADYFGKFKYFHLVPQIIRQPSGFSSSLGESFGSDFIAQMNATPTLSRDAWLRRIQRALKAAVPEFESLTLEVDAAGKPHLVAGYRNWRGSLARQNESDFSDGTLRLIGLLWTLVSGPAKGGVLLLEEPELSLNSAIVRTLPTVLAAAQRDQSMQVLLSSHAPEILDDEGVLPREVLVLRVSDDGTTASLLSEIEEAKGMLKAELPTSDIVDGLVSPRNLGGLIAVGESRRR